MVACLAMIASHMWPDVAVAAVAATESSNPLSSEFVHASSAPDMHVRWDKAHARTGNMKATLSLPCSAAFFCASPGSPSQWPDC